MGTGQGATVSTCDATSWRSPITDRELHNVAEGKHSLYARQSKPTTSLATSLQGTSPRLAVITPDSSRKREFEGTPVWEPRKRATSMTRSARQSRPVERTTVSPQQTKSQTRPATMASTPASAASVTQRVQTLDSPTSKLVSIKVGETRQISASQAASLAASCGDMTRSPTDKGILHNELCIDHRHSPDQSHGSEPQHKLTHVYQRDLLSPAPQTFVHVSPKVESLDDNLDTGLTRLPSGLVRPIMPSDHVACLSSDRIVSSRWQLPRLDLLDPESLNTNLRDRSVWTFWDCYAPVGTRDQDIVFVSKDDMAFPCAAWVSQHSQPAVER